MVKKTITEILKDQTITNQFDFSGSCPDKDGQTVTFTIFDTGYFLDEVTHNFFDRLAFVTEENSFTDFCSRFTKWAQSRGPLFAHMAYGYSLGYNPIENYSSVESHSGDDSFENHKKITHLWTEDTLTHSYDANDPLAVTRLYDPNNPLKVTTGHENDKTKTTYNQVKDTNENNKYGVNSATKVSVSEDINTRTGNEETEVSGSRHDTTTGRYTDTTTGKYTDVHSGSYSDENSGTDKTIYNSTITKNGNIGVQTAAEMLEKEFTNLKNDLALRALWDFMDKCTFYSEGVDILW